MATTFVGRTSELEQIRSVLSVREGPAAAILLGDPGMGKTRLLEAAVVRTDSSRRFKLVGYQVERQVPLAAVAPLLRDLSSEVGARPLSQLLEGDGQAPLEPVRLFEAVHQAFSSPQPTLMVVDDLQWLDDLSLALIHYLVRGAAAGENPLSVLAAARPSAQVTPFVDSLASSLCPERFSAIYLAPLDRHEGVRLAAELAPDLPRATAEELWRQAAGSPFWIEALLRTRIDGLDLAGIVDTRMRGADAETAEFLALVAVAERPITVPEAVRVLDWPADRATRAAGALGDRGLAVVEAGRARLAHDLIRAAALRAIPEETIRRLHSSLAVELEWQARDDLQLLRTALEHRRRAGLPSLALALRLARSPRRALLGHEGLAELAATADAAVRGSEELALQEQIAELATELGDHATAAERWAGLAERLDSASRRAQAFLRAALAARRLGNEAEARAFAGRARASAPDDSALALRLDVLEALALLAARTDDPRGRALAADIARRRRHATCLDRQAYIDALRLEFQLSLYDAEGKRALALADEVAEAARGFDEKLRLEALIQGGEAARLFGAFSAAESRLRPAWNEARALVLPTLVVHAAYGLASCLFRLARLDEAEAIVAEAEELARRLGRPTSQRFGTERVAALIALERGDWPEAVAQVERAIADEPDLHLHIDLHEAAAATLARVAPAHEEKRIRAHLESARAAATSVGCRRCSSELLLVRGEVLARLGRLDEAREVLASGADGSADADPGPAGPFWRARAEAVISSRGSDVRKAISQLERVAADAARLERHLDALWVQLDLAQASARAERAQAVKLLEEVASKATACGARTVANAADRELRRLGVRTWRRGRTGAEGALTERERQIAELAASGASNPEIAQALFLSRKTIERHMSNVLAKLGARNRVELASLLLPEIEGSPR